MRFQEEQGSPPCSAHSPPLQPYSEPSGEGFPALLGDVLEGLQWLQTGDSTETLHTGGKNKPRSIQTLCLEITPGAVIWDT